MLKPIALYIGWRYTRAKRRNFFISFISLSSMLGIGLGVAVLITVLSVMNGFDKEIHQRFFGIAPEITVSGLDGKLGDWQGLVAKLANNAAIKGLAPFIGGQGLLTNNGQVFPIILTGILPDKETAVTQLQKKMLIGQLTSLHDFGIILGRNLAENIGVIVGDKITVFIPQASITPAGMIPRFKRFTVVGIFSAGNGFGFDSKLAFINLSDAQKLLQLGSHVTGLKLKITDPYQAPELSQQLSQSLGNAYQVGNWTDQMGAFFQAVKMEKTMMFLILLLIIAVAAFNLVSSLVMIVNDKQAEIAILRTIGATPALILSIFIVQGMLIGVIGTFIGLIGGIIFASNAGVIVNALQSLLHVQVLSSSIYFVDYLPSNIMTSDLLHVCLVAISMSFLATIYPAWRASKTVIAEALHYE